MKLRRDLPLLILIILVTACQTGGDAPLSKVEQTPTPLIAITQSVPSTPEGVIAEIGLLPILEPIEILPEDFSSESFQDLIIFRSVLYSEPYANFQLHIPWTNGLEPHVFAFSPDGKRAGALTPPQFVSSIHLPSSESGKILMVEYGVEFDHPSVQDIELPAECYPPSSTGDKFMSCGRLQFSEDGRYFGFFYGPDSCGRAIMIQDTHTGTQAYHSKEANGHYFSLLDNGQVLLATGHCEGGGLHLYDLDRGSMVRDLGEEGQAAWNSDHSAIAVEVGSRGAISSSIWGFNLEIGVSFLETPETLQIDDHPVWTPDKQYMLYQHRTFTRASDGFTVTGFNQPRQIILVDAQSGNQRTLLSNPAYDFHIGSCNWYCKEWYGDWIQVRRVEFVPEALAANEDISSNKLYICRIYGENCSAPIELFALNWKTGELRSWDEMVNSGLVPAANITATPIPDQTRTPLYKHPQERYTLYAGPDEDTIWLETHGEGNTTILSGPDLTTAPIYEHPSGLYAFYVGIDGKTLWMVPDKGVPLPWVLDGWDYFYLGKK